MEVQISKDLEKLHQLLDIIYGAGESSKTGVLQYIEDGKEVVYHLILLKEVEDVTTY